MERFPVTVAVQPVATQDVDSKLTFGTIAAALKALDSTTDQVFARIESRAKAERARLQALNTRLDKVRGVIDKISGSTKAITILSKTKYPAAEVARHSTFISLHSNQTSNVIHEVLLDPQLTADSAPLMKSNLLPEDEVLSRPDKRAGLLDTVAKVRWRADNSAEGTRVSGIVSTEPPPQGLGVLPAYLPSVSSMLLFNSKENPYTGYKTVNDLVTDEDTETAVSLLLRGMEGLERKQADARKEEEMKRLGFAPKSLYDGDNLPALAQVEYNYRPKMKALETFELPSNLALPNVADLAWGGDIGLSSIAPTIVKAGEVALPTILDLMPPAPPGPPAPVPAPAPAPAAAAPVAPTPAAPVAPPSMPPMPAAAQPVAAVAAPAPAPVAPAPAAPPIPQGMAALDAPPSAVEGDMPAAAAAPNERMNLLAALSNPDNIRKLKKARRASEDGGGGKGEGGDGAGGEGEEESPSPKKGGGGGGLSMMDELRNKMMSKRQAISGQTQKKEGGEGGAAGAASRRASVAPPPSASIKLKPASDKPTLPRLGEESPSSAAAAASSKPAAAAPSSIPAPPKLAAPSNPEAAAAAAAAKKATPLPPLFGDSEDSGPASSSSAGGDDGSSGGLFNPSAMHGFRALQAAKKAPKRKDSDDWGSDSEDD